jgi:hypothetical protein
LLLSLIFLWPENTGGGNFHRIISNSRTPSGVPRTTGERLLGEIAGSDGMLPLRSHIARISSKMAF